MSTRELREAILPTYARADVTIVRGQGTTVWDDAGKAYLDFCTGIAVVGLGHVHPTVTAATHAQLDLLWHASNLYWTEPMLRLADRLTARLGGGQAFFCNSGAEANEAAIKAARKVTGRAGIVALEGGFHGRTLGALSATGQPSKWEGFGPLVPGMRFARPNDVESLAAAVAAGTGADVAAIMIEPVLGEGGVVPLDPGFTAAAAEMAKEIGALLVVDEVQTGVGRTGTFFAFEQASLEPDLVTMAKGLGNGLPIGALLATRRAAGCLAHGDHGSTFGGNPVVAAAACAVVDAVDDDLLANVRARSTQILHGLERLEGVVEARGRGLLLGARLDRPAGDVVDRCRAAGLLVLTAGPDVLRILPPLVVTADEVDRALAVVAGALGA
jgi:predicted acetylornithine/succinylornithine family transaminase